MNTFKTQFDVIRKPVFQFLDQSVAYGCAGDIISLSCIGERTIFVDNAEYGEYDLACNDDCCSPAPGE